jgi:hypothetical protein
MADPKDSTDSGATPAGAIVVSAALGAVVGAAGLAWWLLERARERRRLQLQRRMLHISRLQPGDQELEPASLPDDRLHDRVQRLNQAIDAVRRQLEELQPEP